MSRVWFRRLLLACAAAMLCAAAWAHPANIPVARAKVQADGTITLSITFDILAFLLDQTPTIVLDAPMNALLDGPSSDLEDRLTTAKARFVEGFSIVGGALDSIDFPSAAEIHRTVDGGGLPRLPVMMTATVRAHLKPGVNKVSFAFPDVLGTVVLTTEFPYEEPASEAVEPGFASTALVIPTSAEIAALATTMKPAFMPANSAKPQTEAQVREAIRLQYDAWSKAYMAHDVDTLLAILAPGYILKTAKGTTMTRAEYEVMLRLRKQKHNDTTRYSTSIQRITLRDGVAAIYSRERTTDLGLNGKTGKTEPVSYEHDYIDLWIQSGNKWLLKSTVTQREQLVR